MAEKTEALKKLTAETQEKRDYYAKEYDRLRDERATVQQVWEVQDRLKLFDEKLQTIREVLTALGL
jgi:hypothetical protein